MNNELSIRLLDSQDEPVLWEMLMYAAYESSLKAVKANPDLIRYVENWGRAGDMGVAAEQDCTPIGAAWLRLWPSDEKGYGYISDDIPELAIALLPNFRGQGIGTKLLKQTLTLAQDQFSAVSLSIRADNPALRLYQRVGFVPVTGSEAINRMGGRSFTMICPLRSA